MIYTTRRLSAEWKSLVSLARETDSGAGGGGGGRQRYGTGKQQPFLAFLHGRGWKITFWSRTGGIWDRTQTLPLTLSLFLSLSHSLPLTHHTLSLSAFPFISSCTLCVYPWILFISLQGASPKLRGLMTSELVSFRIKTPESSLLITSSKPTQNGTRSPLFLSSLSQPPSTGSIG